MDVLYSRQAWLYDLVYHTKPYAKEAERLRDHLLALGIADGARVLEAACGTGRYLEQLKRWYRVAGFDASPDMLAIARKRLPNTELWVDDLRSFTYETPFDAVACLFSSIGYLLTDSDLDNALAAFARATRPGGALVLGPWMSPENWIDGLPWMDTYEDDDLKVCRQCVADRQGEYAVTTMHYLVAARDRPVEHFVETHRLRLLDYDMLLAHITLAGYDATFHSSGPEDRGLFLATRLEKAQE